MRFITTSLSVVDIAFVVATVTVFVASSCRIVVAVVITATITIRNVFHANIYPMTAITIVREVALVCVDDEAASKGTVVFIGNVDGVEY